MNCRICGGATKIRYPGNDPENGPAREYCNEGHAPCYSCGRLFKAIKQYPASTQRYVEDDPESEVVIKAFSTESDWCKICEASFGPSFVPVAEIG